MSNRKQTSRAIAQLASDTLRDPHPSKRGKSLAHCLRFFDRDRLQIV